LKLLADHVHPSIKAGLILRSFSGVASARGSCGVPIWNIRLGLSFPLSTVREAVVSQREGEAIQDLADLWRIYG